MRLKILLQSKFLYIFLTIFLILFIFIKTILITYYSNFSGNEVAITGTIIDYSLDESKLSLTIKSEEIVIAYYYFSSYDTTEFSNLFGREVTLYGEITEPENNTIPNTFNYKEYLYQNGIYYIFSIDEISLGEENFNFKNLVINRINKLESKDYLLMFILGDKSYLDDEMYQVYQENGIAHLLAISGLHINLFILLLERIFSKFKKSKRIKIIFAFLLFYLYLTNYAISVARCVIFQIIKELNEKFSFNLSNVRILYLTALLILLYNPFYIYSTGFQYSFVITYFLLILKPLKKSSYIKSSLKISLIALLASLPITVNMNFEINISTLLFNLIFVPYVSFVVFPLSLLTFIFPFLDSVFSFFTNTLEVMNVFCNNHFSLIVNIPYLKTYFIIFYYAFLWLFIKFKKKYLFFLTVVLMINKLSYKLDSSYYVYYMDIGQGDCSVLISPFQSEVVMIDTGGSYYSTVSDNVILFLKSIGVTNLDLLVITHGDSDHALDAENIYNNLGIDYIMFNTNELNDLELSIKELNIPEVTEVNLDYFTAYNLNDNIDSENDASIVLYFSIYNKTFLFTGDIGTEPLTDLVNKYNVSCDFYKVAHHGSKNNTSEYIIQIVNPEYAFISAGKNNVYNHPSEEVIEILENQEIEYYQTAIDGSIVVQIKENEFNIISYPA